MFQDNLKQRIKTLEYVASITNIKRLKSLTQITSFNKTFQRRLNDALSVKELLSHLDKKLKIGSKLINYKTKSKSKERVLYVYISEATKFKSLSYQKLNLTLKNEFNYENDLLITVGKEALKFSEEVKIEPIFNIENTNEDETIFNLQAAIYELYMLENISKVKFALFSNRIKNNITTILPITDFKINVNDENKEFFSNLDKINFNPSIEAILVQLPQFYINFITRALIIESYFFKLKQNLLREKSLLDSIQDKINELENEIIKRKREKLTEEITFSNQANK